MTPETIERITAMAAKAGVPSQRALRHAKAMLSIEPEGDVFWADLAVILTCVPRMRGVLTN